MTIVAKTRTQLNTRLPEAGKLPWPPFGKAWYAGCTTLIIGNSLKAGIRTFSILFIMLTLGSIYVHTLIIMLLYKLIYFHNVLRLRKSMYSYS